MFRQLLLFLWATSAHAVLFYDTASSTHNVAAPVGAFANSGWQYQGVFGGFLGTAISPTHFITAGHIGVASSTFLQSTLFTGNPDLNHTIDTSVNGGIGYWNIGGTDLRIYQVTGSSFTDYAPLYTDATEVGKTAVVIGRGGPRGISLSVSGEPKGWLTGGSDGVARWGINTIEGNYINGSADLLYADFNAISGVNEAHLSVGDSGGSLFVNDGGIWKLAGINYAVDGRFSLAADGSSPFNAALTDIGGLWIEQAGNTWLGVPENATAIPSSFYVTRISSYDSQITAITMVPEPGSALMAAAAIVVMIGRRRRPVQSFV
jgi:hypothetical protein